MKACEKVSTRLSAYLDDELDDAARAEVSLHLEECEGCRKAFHELKATQGSLREHFAGWMTEAPPPPPNVLDESQNWPPTEKAWPVQAGEKSRTRSIVMKSMTGIAAVVLLTLTFFFLIPGEKVVASPGELIKRAAENYLGWEDVELEISIHLSGLDPLARLSDDDDLDSDDLLGKMRLLLKAPHLVLFHSEGDTKGFPLVDGLFGFDGEKSWTYDVKEKAVKMAGADPESEKLTISFNSENFKHESSFDKDANFMRFFSWDFMKQLNDKSDNLEIKEVTGPYDERVGHRVFEVKLQPKKNVEDGKKGFFEKMFWTRSRLTIDPEEEFIERYQLEVKFSFISLLSFEIEVVDKNRGYDASYFHWSSHVPEGTPVIKAPPKKEEEKEDGVKGDR